MLRNKDILKLAFHLVLHIIIGAAVFCLIAAVALGVHELVGVLESNEVRPAIIKAFKYVEDGIFYADVFLMANFMIVMGKKFIRDLWSETW